MKILTTLVCVPLMAAVAVLPAQSKKVSQETKAKAKIVDSKVTKNDPAIRAIDKFLKKASVNTKRRGWRLTLKAPPKQEFQANCDYIWNVDTSLGLMKIRYFVDTAPMHATSGIYLARMGYYDGLNFHRIIPGFMAQGGCPTGTGSGGPGYFMDGEFPKGAPKHDKAGILSMANTGRPRSDGSQFFLTFGPTPHLNGRHTVWGEVVDGMKTLKALAGKGKRANNGMLGAAGPKIIRTWVEVVPKKGKKDEEHADKAEHGKGQHDKAKAEHGGGDK